jgi:hypothetical protein
MQAKGRGWRGITFSNETEHPMDYFLLCQFVQNPENGDKILPDLLYQGTGMDKIAKIIRNRSAGGAAPNPNCGKPTDEEGREQAKGNHGQANPCQGMVEYSTDKSKATGFGRRQGCELVVVRMKAKYLQLGSGSESGFCCYESAPIEAGKMEVVPGPKVNLIGAGGRFLNAD